MMKAACCAIGLLFGAMCAPILGKDVLLYKVSKGFHYQQTLATAPTILTENGYVFEAQVNLALPGSVTTAMVESTEGTDRVLTADGNDQFEFRNRVNSSKYRASFVDAEDLQFEEGTISEPVGLSFHGLDLGIGPFQGACGNPIVVVGQDPFLEALQGVRKTLQHRR